MDTAEITIVVGQWFSNSTIEIDGYHFERCRFDNCTLRSTRGDFQMTNCYVAANNKLYFLSNTYKQIKLLLHRQQMRGQTLDDLTALKPVANPDGTITI